MIKTIKAVAFVKTLVTSVTFSEILLHAFIILLQLLVRSLKMDKTIINSKPFQLAVRIFGLFTTALLIVTTCPRLVDFIKNDFYSSQPEVKLDYLISITMNLIVIVIGILMAIKPSLYFLIGFASFMYSVVIASANPLNMMHIPMLFLTIGILLSSDFYKKHKSIVIGTIAGICLYEVLIPLRYDAQTFVSSLIQKLGYSFTIIVAIFFFIQSRKDKKEE